MAKREHLEILKRGVAAWNKWRVENPEEKPDLFNVNLKGANLADANLKNANLWEADLNKARLWRADLSGADMSFASLSGADFRGAVLRDANIVDADLAGADLSFAYLRKANLWGADLNLCEIHHSDLREANLSDTKLIRAKISHTDFSNSDLSNSDFQKSVMEHCMFGNVDLGSVKNLETVRHIGPSTIGIDTLFKSSGKIHESFLTGAGVPSYFIAALPSIIISSEQFKSGQIRFSMDDRAFAEKLQRTLSEKGVRCWCVPGEFAEKSKGGSEVRNFDFFLPVISRNALSEQWIEASIKGMSEEEKKRKRSMIFPVFLDASINEKNKPPLADLITENKIADFRKWEDNNFFMKEVNQLIHILGHVPPKTKDSGILPAMDFTLDFPETIYTIIEEKECPYYDKGDRLKLSEHSVLFPGDKPACFILIEDIIQVFNRHKNLASDAEYAFRCSGCTGSIRVAYKKERALSEPGEEKSVEETARMVALLSGFNMFQTINENDLKFLVSYLKTREYNPGDIVIRKGDPGENLYIIAAGQVEVVGDAGLSIAFMGKGEVFGEMSLLSGKPVGATIKVVEPTTIFHLSNKDFRLVLNRINDLQMYFTRLLAKRLNEMHDVRSKEFASGMVGKLSEMPPSELFQTLNANQKTGVISLELSLGAASLSFREGALIRADYGGLSGKEAFYAALKEKEGRFKFIPGLPESDNNLPELGDFMWLLMEGIRMIDEEED